LVEKSLAKRAVNNSREASNSRYASSSRKANNRWEDSHSWDARNVGNGSWNVNSNRGGGKNKDSSYTGTRRHEQKEC
jgi:hypothetical protein